MVREAAHPSGRIPGKAPTTSAGQVMPTRSAAPVMEPAFNAGRGMSTNKTPVRREPAFKTRGGKGNSS